MVELKVESKSSLSQVGLLANNVSQSFKNVTTVRIDGTIYANAGADPVTELAAIVSTGISLSPNFD